MTSFLYKRTLVLGGCGAVGDAWLIGALAGLADAGLHVTDADLFIGNSAGATAAAQITNKPLAELAPSSSRPSRRSGRVT